MRIGGSPDSRPPEQLEHTRYIRLAFLNLIKGVFLTVVVVFLMSYTNHSLPYDQQVNMEYQQHHQDFNHHHYPSDSLALSAAEGRTVLYPSQLHPHPLFTRQGNTAAPPPATIRNRSLELLHHHSHSPFTPPQQQQWLNPYDPQLNYSYPPYPSPSPFPAPRLSPPPVNFKSNTTHNNSDSSSSQQQNNRLTLAGSLDPSTGIFYRTPEHPRLRTAQACEKCRTRKAKVRNSNLLFHTS